VVVIRDTRNSNGSSVKTFLEKDHMQNRGDKRGDKIKIDVSEICYEDERWM
jgi:hypothetical protein